ncbi:MAG: O-acetyl-ADP-ribose deacetylase [Firmicutes bacterium]|nr:O-acetyl-ADP-ribose deacetylase [Bacillota bacterium]
MNIKLVQGDITKFHVDAIVNAANSSLLGGSGVDGAIHRAAGPELLHECRKLGGCKTGQAKITGGYNLPAKFIVHTVGSVYRGGECGEEELLRSCYKSALSFAKKYDIKSFAFPLISAGIYGYPIKEAIVVAVTESLEQIKDTDIEVTIVLYDDNALEAAKQIYPDLLV